MYVSRLFFHTVSGKTGEVEQELKKRHHMVRSAAGNAYGNIADSFCVAWCGRRGLLAGGGLPGLLRLWRYLPFRRTVPGFFR
jgi:hypothetical protein